MVIDKPLCFIIALVVSVLAFGVAVYFFNWIKKQEVENKEIKRVGKLIKDGSRVFLKKEYKILAKFALIVFVLIVVFLPTPIFNQTAKDGKTLFETILLENVAMGIAYLFGTVLSGIAGVIGIEVATNSNMRCAEAAKKGIKPAFITGFRGGAVMGMAVVSLGLIGVTVVYWLTGSSTILLGFSFGASSLALFAKVGGGIFTKTADISADLAGKVELNIPEDDPRNPGVIADNVGDNVGDVAGMGADLFDSNVASFAATITICATIATLINVDYVPLVFLFASIGLLSSIIGVLTGRIGKKGSPTGALNKSTYVTTGIFIILTGACTAILKLDYKWNIWISAVIGLLVGIIIGITTDYFTNDARKPVKNCAKASELGPAFTVLSGTSYGFLSCFPAIVGIAISALASYLICKDITPGDMTGGMFGISIAAVGMLSIVAMIVSNDAYGPIVDNARGLAEMGGLDEKVIEITDELDSAGNTVKAITKGFSISAAGLTVIALLGAFVAEVNANIANVADQIKYFDIMDPVVFFGILVGSTVPAVFSALLIKGVDRNAQRMLNEIHRQFYEIPGLKEGKEGVTPEYDKCIAIATHGAVKELIVSGGFTIICTIVTGFIGGVKAIGGFLLGNIVVGLFLALYMSNAGGLWDNSKKYVEAGNNGGKGSTAHKAAVVGDTIGDPFKDTAGPSINTQITVVSLIASLLAYVFTNYSIF